MSPDSTVGDAFERAFGILRQSGMRDEYVYRSAIAQKILLGRHSLNTATMLNELRAGECKADVVVLNGTSTAYEIKSDRDSLTRLTNQLSNYRAVFASVNVVVGHSHLDDVLTLVPHDVGVLLLTNRFRLSVVREAIDLPERTSPLMILEILRIDEAASILRNLGLEAPEVPNTRIRTEFKDIFIGLDPGVVHKQMVEVLRRTRSQAPLAAFVGSLPDSVKAASLAAKPNVLSRSHISDAINTPLVEALAWK